MIEVIVTGSPPVWINTDWIEAVIDLGAAGRKIVMRQPWSSSPYYIVAEPALTLIKRIQNAAR